MIPLDEDSYALILEWLRSSTKSGQVKMPLLSGAKALIALYTMEKWATELRDYYQAEQYYLRGNTFLAFLDALYNERNYPHKSTRASPDEPESTIGVKL
ncbi:MAG: hypothetical protein ACLQPD_03845 [Desulfomonilaceae bacterium]